MIVNSESEISEIGIRVQLAIFYTNNIKIGLRECSSGDIVSSYHLFGDFVPCLMGRKSGSNEYLMIIGGNFFLSIAFFYLFQPQGKCLKPCITTNQ